MCGTYKTVEARFWLWLSSQSPEKSFSLRSDVVLLWSEVFPVRSEAYSYLTQYINRMVSKSQLSHRIVNSLLTITDQNDKLTIFGGAVDFSKTI